MIKERRSTEESDLENDTTRWISISINGEKNAATLNLVKGDSVYGEKLVKYVGEEYRIWDPFRSKLAAALKKGMKNMPIKSGSRVLYLGASTGTTVSHVSDIVGPSASYLQLNQRQGLHEILLKMSLQSARMCFQYLKMQENTTPILQFSARSISSTAILHSLTRQILL